MNGNPIFSFSEAASEFTFRFIISNFDSVTFSNPIQIEVEILSSSTAVNRRQSKSSSAYSLWFFTVIVCGACLLSVINCWGTYPYCCLWLLSSWKVLWRFSMCAVHILCGYVIWIKLSFGSQCTDGDYDFVLDNVFSFSFTDTSAISVPPNITIQIRDDNVVERDETIYLRVRDVSDVRGLINVANTQVPLTIIDNDSKCEKINHIHKQDHTINCNK